MKKFVLAALSLFAATGLILAASVVVVKCDPETRKITVKEGDTEKEYTLSDKLVVKMGDKEIKSEFAMKMLSNPKQAGKLKIDITTEKDTITEIKLPERKKNKDKN